MYPEVTLTMGIMAMSNRSFPALAALASVVTLALSGCLGGTRQADLMHVDCLNPPDPGSCHGRLEGYYYDYQTDRCRRFTYGDCDARVPFESLEGCMRACGGSL